MTDHVQANIHFFLHGNAFASRTWWFVPRVGDEVILGPEDNRTAYKVTRVVWGNDQEGWRAVASKPWQRVNIEIEEVPND